MLYCSLYEKIAAIRTNFFRMPRFLMRILLCCKLYFPFISMLKRFSKVSSSNTHLFAAPRQARLNCESSGELFPLFAAFFASKSASPFSFAAVFINSPSIYFAISSVALYIGFSLCKASSIARLSFAEIVFSWSGSII